MAVTDLQKCIHIINNYGSHAEKRAMDELRNMTWDGVEPREAHEILSAIVSSYMLDTANEIYADCKNNHNNEWFMLGNE